MSNEELMQDRRRVTVHYPNSRFTVGDIVTKAGIHGTTGKTGILWCDILDCPDVFEEVHWWEERKPEDMPEYVKEGDDVYKVHTWDGTRIPFVYINDVKRDHYVWGSESAPVYGDILPATLQEYEAFINKK